MIKISESVPLPLGHEQRKHRARKSERQEAIGKLEVKHSFFLKTSISSACTLLWWAQARFPEREFTSEKEKDGVRIWRTK
jgi:hypothetical protein